MNPQASPPERGGNPRSVAIEMSNDLNMITYIRMALRQLFPPLDEDTGAMFYGAVTEILSNAVEAHRRGNSDTTPVVIEALLDPPQSIVVKDRGDGFDPDQLPLAAGPDSGMGLTIARAVVPGLSIESGSAGTSVRLPYPTS